MTALIGPFVTVEGPNGALTVRAGLIVSLKEGFEALNGATVDIGLGPTLVPRTPVVPRGLLSFDSITGAGAGCC